MIKLSQEDLMKVMDDTSKLYNLVIDKYEESIGMKDLKNKHTHAFWGTGNNKKWFACSPKWKTIEDLKTDYPIVYWVNYGDGTTYGYFSVEQIKEWLTTPDLLLCTLGGTVEK